MGVEAVAIASIRIVNPVTFLILFEILLSNCNVVHDLVHRIITVIFKTDLKLNFLLQEHVFQHETYVIF
jgi:hypothetical protein